MTAPGFCPKPIPAALWHNLLSVLLFCRLADADVHHWQRRSKRSSLPSAPRRMRSCKVLPAERSPPNPAHQRHARLATPCPLQPRRTRLLQGPRAQHNTTCSTATQQGPITEAVQIQLTSRIRNQLKRTLQSPCIARNRWRAWKRRSRQSSGLQLQRWPDLCPRPSPCRRRRLPERPRRVQLDPRFASWLDPSVLPPAVIH